MCITSTMQCSRSLLFELMRLFSFASGVKRDRSRTVTRRRRSVLCLLGVISVYLIRNTLNVARGPTVSIHVLTCCRPASLSRLLLSLSNAHYESHTGPVELYIHIDWAFGVREAKEVFAVAQNFSWPHGSEFLLKRFKRAGLATAWFELAQTARSD